MYKRFILISSIFLCQGISISQTLDEFDLVKKADSAYSFKEWGKKDDPLKIDSYKKAKSLYYQVLSLYPENQYSQNRIIEIDRVLSDFKYKPEYSKTIATADSLYKRNKFGYARHEYIKADSLLSLLIDKKNRSFIKNQITRCNDAIKIGIPDSSIAFIKSVQVADQLFANYVYEIATHNHNETFLDSSYIHYLKAIRLCKTSIYVQERIDEIKKIKSSYKPQFHRFNEYLRSLDLLYADQQYEKALKGYKSLLIIKPNNSYIIKMIEECKNKMK